MPSVQQQREKLINLLKQLFQLDQPDLDFGFYKIMHAKSEQVQRFLENDLLDIIKKEFGELDGDRIEEAKVKYETAIEQAKKFGAPNPEETDGVKEAKQEYENAKQGGSPEGDIYDHLWRFFERYYDNGDFLSRRYYARETAGKAAPYAIPYDGREVYLHWANKDQYYIKTSEYLSNFTFNPTKSKEYQKQAGELLPKDEQGIDNLKVHCRIIEAAEGEHGNIKTSEGQQRYFIIDGEQPIKLENGELIIQFHYHPDPEKTGQDGTWKQKRLSESVETVISALKKLPEAKTFLNVLLLPAPTDKQKDRPLLAKYLNQYTARNTMDYFIHKDLGGFLSRELDFYIKNEIMRLDDIENADAPRVETYLAKIRVLRKIARHLIDFLSQLEEFQKKLWLKKKFVTETNYCITLDQIPEEFYSEITANEQQRKEWVKLFVIDEVKGDLATVAYSEPLTVGFLKENKFLVLDTKYFSNLFVERILAEIESVDSLCDGVLLNSENYQALGTIENKYKQSIRTVYLDPPYNSGSDDFPYKDSFRNSSWLSMLQDRLLKTKKLLREDGVLFVHIDDKDEDNRVSHHLMSMVEGLFGKKNYLDNLVWTKNTTHNDAKAFSHNHEFIIAFCKNRDAASERHVMFRQNKPGFSEVQELVHSINTSFPAVVEVGSEIRKLYKEQAEKYKAECLAQGLEWNDDIKRNDPWKGIRQYKYAEYRLDDGGWISEDEAKKKNAKIWVYREDNPSWPNASSLTKDQKTEGHTEYRFYKPKHPVTGKSCPAPARGWLWRERPNPEKPTVLSFEMLDQQHLIAYGEDENKIPQQKRFLHTVETDVVKSTIADFTDGEKELANIIGERGTFPNPKPTTIGRKLVEITTDYDDIVLDYFAGSGTTAHAVLQQNMVDDKSRRFVLVEMGRYFNTTLLPRVKKNIYSVHWKDGKPITKNGKSGLVKYQTLESYEETLGNIKELDADRMNTFKGNKEFQQDYMLNYWLNMETQGSPSLLNIEQFTDPIAYTLKVKKPGTDEYEDKNVDLIETFNWLIGLHMEHMDIWRSYDASFKREKDPELPEDGNTKLVIDGKLKETNTGKYAFRKIEGWEARTPGNTEDREKVLVVWRKLSGNLEEDNAVLDEWFRKLDIRSRDSEFDVIYVNGSNNLPNLRSEEEHWKVRLLEETFHQKMWNIEDI